MSQNRHTLLVDWGFRLIIVALAILWLVFPPLGAENLGAESAGAIKPGIVKPGIERSGGGYSP